MYKRIIFVSVLLCFLSAALSAQAAGINRADPRSIWDGQSNPAAWGLDPAWFSSGFRASLDFSGQTVAMPAVGTLDAVISTPFFMYQYQIDEAELVTHSLISAFSVGRSIAFGYRTKFGDTEEQPEQMDAGLLWRPDALWSFGLTADNFLSAGRTFGAGLAIRPLAAFSRQWGPSLTISTDASWRSQAFVFENVALRLGLADSLVLRLWYDFVPQTFGLGVSLGTGPLKYDAVLADVTRPAVLGLASSISLDSGRMAGVGLLPGSRNILVIDGKEPVSAVPGGAYSLLPGLDGSTDFDSLIRTIDRAAADRSIKALLLLDPVSPGSDARSQELAAALQRFRSGGKALYVYASTLSSSAYIHLAAQADFLAMDPNSLLPLVELSYINIYFRGLLESLGLRFVSLRSHDTKTAGNPFTEYGITEAERAMFLRLTEARAAQQHAALAEGRSGRLTKPAADLIAGGPYLNPETAVAVGLIDALMYREQFDEHLETLQPKARFVSLSDYSQKRDLAWGDLPFSRKVAVVHLYGNILDDEGVAGVSIGQSAVESLQALREDASVKGVILRVDSGGGAVLTSDRIAREVELMVQSGRPVYVSMGDFAASGGYYISAMADRIYADPGTLTGSIGVISLALDATALLEKLKIGVDTVELSQSSGFANPLRAPRQEDLDLQTEWISHVYQRFVAVVAKGRSLDPARVDELGRGQIWLGSEALQHGLVDELGGLFEAKAAMAETLGGRVVFVDQVPGANPMANWLPRLLSARVTAAAGSMNQALQEGLLLADTLQALGSGPLYLLPDSLWRQLQP